MEVAIATGKWNSHAYALKNLWIGFCYKSMLFYNFSVKGAFGVLRTLSFFTVLPHFSQFWLLGKNVLTYFMWKKCHITIFVLKVLNQIIFLYSFIGKPIIGPQKVQTCKYFFGRFCGKIFVHFKKNYQFLRSIWKPFKIYNSPSINWEKFTKNLLQQPGVDHVKFLDLA